MEASILVCSIRKQAEGKPCVLEQRHIRAALKGAAKSDHALGEGFAAALMNTQQAAVLDGSIGFALRPSIVRPQLASLCALSIAYPQQVSVGSHISSIPAS